jgi:hypothetical protein
MHVDIIDGFATPATTPPGRDKRHPVPGACEAAEHFVKMDFGTTRPRVEAVEPIEHEDVKRHRVEARDAKACAVYRRPVTR